MYRERPANVNRDRYREVYMYTSRGTHKKTTTHGQIEKGGGGGGGGGT